MCVKYVPLEHVNRSFRVMLRYLSEVSPKGRAKKALGEESPNAATRRRLRVFTDEWIYAPLEHVRQSSIPEQFAQYKCRAKKAQESFSER